MLLGSLLHSLEYIVLQGCTTTEITGISDHSVSVRPGDLFVCIKGYRTDSHHYLPEVASAGAHCVVVEQLSDRLETVMNQFPLLTVLLVRDTLKALALLASAFYGDPSHRMKVIGITGTKGKTTVAFMLNAILRESGIRSGMIGTLGAWFDETLETPATTTPDPISLHRLLRQMGESGCTHVVLEVSSQSLMRRRVYGIPFALAIYTNLYPDHISRQEHSSLEEYAYWKSTLFAHAQISVINKDASFRFLMRGMALGEVIEYSLAEWECSHKDRLDISLPGRYNQENALAAITAAQRLGLEKNAFDALKTLRIPGRTEVLEGNGYKVVIDYAHNESSLEKLLQMLRTMKPKRLICIYGSGGERSVLRRYGMGRAGGTFADLSVLTEDNSRSEPLDMILAGLIDGVTSVKGDYVIIPDRHEAIHWAIGSALEGDLIAIVGKGHETWQEIRGERFYFSDRDEAETAINMRHNINKLGK